MVESAKFSIQLLHPKFWGVWLGVGLMRLTLLLPLTVQMKIGAAIGRLAQSLISKRVKTAAKNFELCFPDMPESDRKKLLDKNFEETGKALFDTINAWWWTDKRIKKHMKIKGLDNLKDTLASGHGVILFAVHCLPLEMGARIIGQVNPGVGVYRPHNNPVMEYLQVKGRLRSNKGLVPKRDIRKMVKCLRGTEMIWYTADQDFGRSSAVFIPFYNVKEAATITGATTLARLGKAKIVPLFVERDIDDNGYLVEFMPPLENFPGESELEDAVRGNKIIEDLIDRNRPQYMWLHRRFKTRPETSDVSLYK
ncbi:LpxL/LpxP family Kdo(2)-lipid IV(A) lauroyl/palmitoleoyl acyltransferase [Parashewanella spongiae]|uniref:Lipid A biosynthesis acyltransferase n=1 Tax=Parashewanella spongiae TaxID=342950 RepID=A0A3A6TV20_9GAMM|nr:LpxL/LpxP family Kdo(2)-lipid IV(A) lauroyl/palmitoleoyl acyltransferase [Parashewanella spongiae]MCL1077653.1 LpxL/LpxP family Kdo(2)-lipid IV(A) lauroyl/palmitoleoyl acyltransferase [Parashewanella spongiae]RJY18120.1 LpxL/LpxP family Kdo(2)-lipid IV(A) lauroyl/palmitoleoyl acyltransferase [Parashewanella spongiae]